MAAHRELGPGLVEDNLRVQAQRARDGGQVAAWPPLLRLELLRASRCRLSVHRQEQTAGDHGATPLHRMCGSSSLTQGDHLESLMTGP